MVSPLQMVCTATIISPTQNQQTVLLPVFHIIHIMHKLKEAALSAPLTAVSGSTILTPTVTELHEPDGCNRSLHTCLQRCQLAFNYHFP